MARKKLMTMVDVESLVKEYAQDMEMSMNSALKFLASRDSLDTAANLIGLVDVNDDKGKNKAAYAAMMSDFLTKNGMTPPSDGATSVEDYLNGFCSTVSIQVERYRALAELGWLDQEIAELYGVTINLFRSWKKENILAVAV